MTKDQNKAAVLKILKEQNIPISLPELPERLHGSEMDKYIKSRSDKLADPGDQKQFIRNIHEDLEHLGPQSIIGMGITIRQVEHWQKNGSKS